jgi:succinyl-diaminopimelate desuccinylase
LYEVGKGKPILLFGHLDTVSSTGDWKSDPYRLTKKGDRLYGLGAWDMKAGLSAILTSIKNFIPRGFKLKIAFVVDEENYSLGMHKLIQSGWLDDVGGAISLEPGFVYGARGITLGRVGRSVYEVNIKTKGGHTYLVDADSNAIEIARRLLNSISNMRSVKHTKLGLSQIFPRSIKSEVSGMSYPHSVTVELEANIVPPQTGISILNELKQVLKEFGRVVRIQLKERPTPYCDPYITEKNDTFVRWVSSVVSGVNGEAPSFYYRRSVADENRIASLGIPIVTVGPGGGNAHQANEWVSEKSLKNITKFLNAFLVSYNSN